MTEIVKFDRIVSVNSEIQGHPAQNILHGEISPSKNWLCEPGTDKAVLILQLERATVLTSIHIGNAHSAFVEILVGTAADSKDQFESFVPMSFLMNPHESKTGTNPNRTRLFTKDDFNKETAAKSWDRVKIVCTQPFNKHVPYGLCFFRVNGEKKKGTAMAAAVVEEEEEKGEIKIGSFFKKKRASAGDKPLTVSEQIKEAEKDSSLLKHTPLSIAKITERLTSEKKPKPTPDESKQPKKAEEETKRKNKDSTPNKPRKDEKKEKEAVKRKTEEKPEGEKRKKQKREEKKRKPFERLMEDVVLVISGFKNPLRGDIRSKALAMGARYSSDWEPHCTHLVSAFENTPKCQQVRGKGKIVKKEWVEKCHGERKRYPWRRFALFKDDGKKAESEEEIETGNESEPEDEVECSSASGTSKQGEDRGRRSEKKKSDGDDYGGATDDEEPETQLVDTTEYPMPFLPDIFSRKTFYLDPNLQTRRILERYITAYNGIVTEIFDSSIDYYITERGGAPVEMFRKKAPNLVAVKPSWIWEINSEQKYVGTGAHLVKGEKEQKEPREGGNT